MVDVYGESVEEYLNGYEGFRTCTRRANIVIDKRQRHTLWHAIVEPA